jgi:hypothetical protein
MSLREDTVRFFRNLADAIAQYVLTRAYCGVNGQTFDQKFPTPSHASFSPHFIHSRMPGGPTAPLPPDAQIGPSGHISTPHPHPDFHRPKIEETFVVGGWNKSTKIPRTMVQRWWNRFRAIVPDGPESIPKVMELEVEHCMLASVVQHELQTFLWEIFLPTRATPPLTPLHIWEQLLRKEETLPYWMYLSCTFVTIDEDYVASPRWRPLAEYEVKRSPERYDLLLQQQNLPSKVAQSELNRRSWYMNTVKLQQYAREFIRGERQVSETTKLLHELRLKPIAFLGRTRDVSQWFSEYQDPRQVYGNNFLPQGHTVEVGVGSFTLTDGDDIEHRFVVVLGSQPTPMRSICAEGKLFYLDPTHPPIQLRWNSVGNEKYLPELLGFADPIWIQKLKPNLSEKQLQIETYLKAMERLRDELKLQDSNTIFSLAFPRLEPDVFASALRTQFQSS